MWEERGAYKNLLSQWSPQARRVVITGPVVTSADDPAPMLEVKRFEFSP